MNITRACVWFLLTAALTFSGCGVCDEQNESAEETAPGEADNKGDQAKGDQAKGDQVKGDKAKGGKAKGGKDAKKGTPDKGLKKGQDKRALAPGKTSKSAKAGKPGQKVGKSSLDLKRPVLTKPGVDPKTTKPVIPKSPPATKLEDVKPTSPSAKGGGVADKGVEKFLKVDSVLSRTDVKAATGYRGILRPGELDGINAEANYNALRLTPTSRSQFGVAVQLWRETNPGAQSRRFNDLLRQYPGSERIRDIGDSAFRASFGELRYLVWLDRKRRVTIALTCDDKVCKGEQDVLGLAKVVSGKLKKY